MKHSSQRLQDYRWQDSSCTCAHNYLLPRLEEILEEHAPPSEEERVLDLGCGNGAVTKWLANQGYEVVGVDPLSEGIAQARKAYPELDFYRMSAYETLKEKLGSFSVVVSLEVVEHVYDPVQYASTIYDVLSPLGTAILSTPYHGWLKNVVISILGRFDDHVEPLQVHGHIKFWSPTTLSKLL